MKEKEHSSKFSELSWMTPTILIPHGIAGCITMGLGLILTLCSMFGHYSLINSNLLYVYIISTAINAIGALILVKRQGSKYVKTAFRLASMMQLSLMWTAFRFRPVQE